MTFHLIPCSLCLWGIKPCLLSPPPIYNIFTLFNSKYWDLSSAFRWIFVSFFSHWSIIIQGIENCHQASVGFFLSTSFFSPSAFSRMASVALETNHKIPIKKSLPYSNKKMSTDRRKNHLNNQHFKEVKLIKWRIKTFSPKNHLQGYENSCHWKETKQPSYDPKLTYK